MSSRPEWRRPWPGSRPPSRAQPENPLWANSASEAVELSGLRASVHPVNVNLPSPGSPQMNGGAPAYGLDDHIYQRLLRERIVFLGSEVRDQNANAICAQL